MNEEEVKRRLKEAGIEQEVFEEVAESLIPFFTVIKKYNSKYIQKVLNIVSEVMKG